MPQITSAGYNLGDTKQKIRINNFDKNNIRPNDISEEKNIKGLTTQNITVNNIPLDAVVNSINGLKTAIYNRVKPVLSSKQLKIYTSMGGTPHLDGRYTDFGNIIWGMHVAEQISVCAKDTRDRPMGDMRFTIRKMTWAEHLKPFSKW